MKVNAVRMQRLMNTILVLAACAMAPSGLAQVSASRALSVISISAGSSTVVTLSINVDESNRPNAAIIVEILPQGWTPSNESPARSSFDPVTREVRWLLGGFTTLVDTSITYTLTSPGDVSPGLFPISGESRFTSAGSNQAVPTTGSNSVTIAPCFGLTITSGTTSTAEDCTGGYTDGKSVAIVANTAPAGKVFDKWTGDVASVASVADVNAESTTITMNGNKAVEATYKTPCRTLTITSGTTPTAQDCTGGYTDGKSVAIVANTAPAGKVFDKWTGDVASVASVADVNAESTTITMNGNKAVEATFTEDVPCASPTGLTASDATSLGSVSLTWNEVAGATEYKIYRNTTEDFATAVFVGSSDSAAFVDGSASTGYWIWERGCLGIRITDPNAANPFQCGGSNTGAYPGTRYTYWVVAIDGDCESEPSTPDTGNSQKASEASLVSGSAGDLLLLGLLVLALIMMTAARRESTRTS